MRRLPFVALALVVLSSLGPALTTGAPPGPPTTRQISWDVVALACAEAPDGICLAYDGIVPGPTLDINLGDTVVLHVTNRIPGTVAGLEAPAETKARLSAASVSFHVHGTAIGADVDGVGDHPGTQLVPSYVRPNETFTYTFRAAFQGVWHYHDHVLGADGSEGIARGLFGSLVVRAGGEPRPDHVLDLHLDDRGANGGRGLDASVTHGDDFEMVLASLGNAIWTVTLHGPDGAPIAHQDLGPGESHRFLVRNAQLGSYTWQARNGPDEHTGQVVVS